MIKKLLLTLCLLLPLTSFAVATTTIRFGFTDYSDGIKTIAQDLFVNSGARFARLNGGEWTTISSTTQTCVLGPKCTTDGTYYYNWDVPGYDLDDLVDNGTIGTAIEITKVGNLTPDFPNHNFKTPFEDPKRYVYFVAELARHFKGRVTDYIMDNEPAYSFYTYQNNLNDSANNYITLFKVTANVLKLVDRNARLDFDDGITLYGANPDTNPFKGIDAMEKLGALNKVGIMDHHFYGTFSTSTENPDILDWQWQGHTFDESIDYFDAKFAKYGLYPEKYLFETGFATGDSLDATNTTYELRVQNQGQDLIKSHLMGFSKGITMFSPVVLVDRTYGPMVEDLDPTATPGQYGTRCITKWGDVPEDLTGNNVKMYKDIDGVIHATTTKATTVNIGYPWIYYSSTNDNFRCSGIVTGNLADNGYANAIQPKASYYPYQQMTSLLTPNMHFASSSTSTPVMLYQFEGPTKTVYGYFSNQNVPDYGFNITLPQTYQSGYKINGLTLATSSMNLGFASGTVYPVSASSTVVKWMLLNK